MAFKSTSSYIATRDLEVAVNAAVALQRPLLVKGEPGTGKTVLAHEVSRALGMPSIDAKLAVRDPAGWRRLAERTSVLPFGAILAGRNRLSLREIGWLAPLLGLLLWAAVLHFHQKLFGVAPVALG